MSSLAGVAGHGCAALQGVRGSAFEAVGEALRVAYCFGRAQDAGLLGVRSWATVAVCVLSWLFAFSANAGLLRALRTPASPPLRLYAVLTSVGAGWIALHLSRYGLIGLRTWQW